MLTGEDVAGEHCPRNTITAICDHLENREIRGPPKNTCYNTSNIGHIRQHLARDVCKMLMDNLKTAQVLISVNWLPVVYRLEYNILVQACEAFHRTATHFSKEPFPAYQPTRFPSTECQ